jgi:hypothetical protein
MHHIESVTLNRFSFHSKSRQKPNEKKLEIRKLSAQIPSTHCEEENNHKADIK